MRAAKEGKLNEARKDSVDRRKVVTSSRAVVEPSHRVSDVIGIVCLAIAAILGVSLAIGSSGLVGEALGNLVRSLCGKGAWVTPFLAAAFGVGFLLGRKRLDMTRSAWGGLVIFLGVMGALATPVSGDYFDPDTVSTSGGYAGAVVGWLMSTLFGVGKPIGIGALCMVGVILLLNEPLRVAASSLGRRRARQPATEPVSRRAQVVPNRAVATLPAIEEEPESDRPTKRAPKINETIQPKLDITQPVPKEGYTLPPLSLLNTPVSKPKRTAEEMQANIDTLESTLAEFGIEADVVEIATGPTVTRYEIQLGPGIRVARITALADNIAMNLAASHVRVEAPIPGKAAIGVEVPNSQPTPVHLQELCDSSEFQNHASRLAVALGQDVSGKNKYADLTKMPHLLIGGATNSGKSIGLASIIMSLLMRNTPKDVKLVMIDPKRVELTLFDGIPHLMCPVVKDVKEAPGVLRAVWREMDRRYDLFAEAAVRNIDGWNEKATFNEKLPYVVVIIDELADMMIQAAAEVETSICRLAQLARATGIHLVIATQRPSVDVITGTIKANIASRMAFSVSSHIDSRTILDQKGAEALVGKGDMLFLPIDASKPTRIQGCYVAEKEIERVCTHWRDQEKPQYVLNPIQTIIEDREAEMAEQESDPLWEETVRWVVDRGQASTSMLQRRFSIGFQRASRLLDLMEERGIVGARDGPRPREVLIDPAECDVLFGRRTAWDGPNLEMADDSG